MPEIYQITVKLLDGKSNLLNFTTPSISILSIKDRLNEITGIPISQQRLLTGTTHLTDSSTLNPIHGSHSYPTVHLLGRLLGGKGGFGSLLRGAATKAGQKKTNNFDACRDMSGRRLRHVNAEKKLEEWRAEEGERRLEKIAEDFLKKKSKELAKKVGKAGEAEKYVAKYREDSAKCMEVVEKSVREAMGGSKRKGGAGGGSEADSKRLKIWMGKRAVEDSDSEDDSDNDEEENDKSVVLNNENQSDSHDEADRSPGSVTGQKLDGVSSAGISSDSCAEEGADTKGRSSGESSPSSDARVFSCENNGANEPAMETSEEIIVENVSVSVLQEAVASGVEACKDDKQEPNELANLEGTVEPHISADENRGSLAVETTVSEVNINSEIKPGQETMVVSEPISDAATPLNFKDFSSAAELEALGMERLKSELQSHGLKCGGTLQERAARLFLLKTTPIDKLPKKLLAKK